MEGSRELGKETWASEGRWQQCKRGCIYSWSSSQGGEFRALLVWNVCRRHRFASKTVFDSAKPCFLEGGYHESRDLGRSTWASEKSCNSARGTPR